MSDYLLVELAKGPGWDHARTRREQDGWDAHAAFMDGLVEDGVILMGGPVDDVEGELTMHVVDLPDEAAARARFAEDPWSPDKLVVHAIRPWHVWLRRQR